MKRNLLIILVLFTVSLFFVQGCKNSNNNTELVKNGEISHADYQKYFMNGSGEKQKEEKESPLKITKYPHANHMGFFYYLNFAIILV